jgi:hypothetical protein
MASPLRISPNQMYTLAVFCILEGSPDLRNVAEQLKVAAVIVNRTHSSNWSKQFGAGIVDQMFARDARYGDQFEIIKRFGLDSGDFVSLELAAKALTEAKPALSQQWSKELVIAFARAAADPAQYGAATKSVGENTGFRGVKGVNVFRRESPKYDQSGLEAKQPSCIMVDWGKETPLF